MESCVTDLMGDSKMKSKYPNADERKSHAIAICHSSIMGKGNNDKHIFVGNLEQETEDNADFRRVLCTASHSQLVLMSIAPQEEIGMETHTDSDQFFRIEEGQGKAVIDGVEYDIEDGFGIVVPAGIEHNIVNTSEEESLKLYTIYSPPQHEDGLIQHTKAEAENKIEGGEHNMTKDIEKAVWTTAFVNNLPDSSFAHISPGGKKDSDGKTVPRSLRHLPYKNADGKPDAAHVRNALARLPQTDIPAEAKASAHSKLVAAAKELNIEVSSEEKKIDANVDDKLENVSKGGEQKVVKKDPDQAEEAKEMQDCIAGYVKEGKTEAEARKQCKIDLKGEEEEEKEDGKVPEKESPMEDSEKKVSGVEDLVKQVLTRLDEIETSLKKEDVAEESASVEGAAPVEETLEVPAEEAVVAETAEDAVVKETAEDAVVKETAEDAAVEEAPVGDSSEETENTPVKETGEKIAKVSDSLTKISDSIEKMAQQFEDFEKRINALEEQPAPSKIVSPKVVTKSMTEEDSDPRLKEIETELTKLEDFRNKNTEQYQKERAWEKAFDLIAEKERLLR